MFVARGLVARSSGGPVPAKIEGGKASNISNATDATAKFEHQSKQALIGVLLNFEIRLVFPPKEHCLKSGAGWPFV